MSQGFLHHIMAFGIERRNTLHYNTDRKGGRTGKGDVRAERAYSRAPEHSPPSLSLTPGLIYNPLLWVSLRDETSLIMGDVQ